MSYCCVCDKTFDCDGYDCIGNHICDGCLKDFNDLVEALKETVKEQEQTPDWESGCVVDETESPDGSAAQMSEPVMLKTHNVKTFHCETCGLTVKVTEDIPQNIMLLCGSRHDSREMRSAVVAELDDKPLSRFPEKCVIDKDLRWIRSIR